MNLQPVSETVFLCCRIQWVLTRWLWFILSSRAMSRSVLHLITHLYISRTFHFYRMLRNHLSHLISNFWLLHSALVPPAHWSSVTKYEYNIKTWNGRRITTASRRGLKIILIIFCFLSFICSEYSCVGTTNNLLRYITQTNKHKEIQVRQHLGPSGLEGRAYKLTPNKWLMLHNFVLF